MTREPKPCVTCRKPIALGETFRGNLYRAPEHVVCRRVREAEAAQLAEIVAWLRRPLIDVPSVAWVLECGCEPMVEHCSQCDERRKVRSAALDENRDHEARLRIADALERGEWRK